MTTIRPGTLGLLKARQRQARGGGAGGGDRLIAADGVQFPDGVRQEQEEPGPGARDAPSRVKSRLKGEAISRQAAQGQRVDPEEIGRDLPGVGEALDPTSSPGALEARFDAGVFFHYDIGEAISRETVTQDVLTAQVVVGAASTTERTVFSVQEDHYLQFLSPRSDAAANLQSAALYLQPFGDPDEVLLTFWDGAPIVADPSGTGDTRILTPQEDYIPDFPIFIRRETDYIFAVRSGGGGGLTVDLELMITRAPDGARIPR